MATKKSICFFSLLLFTFLAQAQERFQTGIYFKAGYYFPQTKSEITNVAPDNVISPGLGAYINYQVVPKMEISVGGAFNYLHTKAVIHSGLKPSVDWHSVDVPVQVNVFPYKQFLLTGGINIVTQVSETFQGYRNPEWNWQAGAGWDFNRYRLMLVWSHGFESRYKYISVSEFNSFVGSNLKFREIALKLEVPLWKF